MNSWPIWLLIAALGVACWLYWRDDQMPPEDEDEIQAGAW